VVAIPDFWNTIWAIAEKLAVVTCSSFRVGVVDTKAERVV
jgi:hypothetical protein